MRQGLELDYQYQFNKLKLDSNLTYILQGDSNKEDDQADTVSKILIKVAGLYAWGNHTLGASLRSATKRRNVSSSHMLNAKYQYQPAPYFSYGIELIDVLDDRVKQPNVRNAPDLVAESSLGRTMLIGLKYMF